MKITFISEDNEEGYKVTLETPEFQSWGVALYYFQQFLEGNGFIFKEGKMFDLVDGDPTYNLDRKYNV